MPASFYDQIYQLITFIDSFLSILFTSIGLYWSSICIQLLLFHNNQNNVYPHSFRDFGVFRAIVSQ